MNADAQLYKNIESLTRGAFLRAMEEDHAPGMGIEQCVERTLLSGMATGDLAPISEAEFSREFATALQQPMGGLFKKMKKKLRKAVKKIGVGRAVKSAVRITKKVANKTFKVVKKVAPYAAAGAALYYGAPYLMKGGSYLYDKAAGLIGGSVAPAMQAGQQIAGSALQSAAANRATQYATQMLSNQGINMASPESQAALSQYMQQQTPQYMPPPPPQVQPYGGKYQPEKPAAPDWTKYALPAAGVLATALLLKA